MLERNSRTETVSIRKATDADISQMLSIYGPYITDTSVSFELSVPSESEFRNRISEAHTWLVYEVEEKIAGYAYASKHRAREAYRFSVEVSAYIAQGFQRRGIASSLYTEILKELKARDFHMAFAGITLPNDSSVAFHESMGFTSIGIYRETGFKFGNWHDVGWWQKKI